MDGGCAVLIVLLKTDGRIELSRLSTNVFTIDRNDCTSDDDEVALSAVDNGTFSDEAVVRVCSPLDVYIGKCSPESIVLNRLKTLRRRNNE